MNFKFKNKLHNFLTTPKLLKKVLRKSFFILEWTTMTLATDQSLTLDFNFRGHLDLKIHQNIGRVARVWLRLKPKKLPNYKKTLKKYSRAYFSLNWAQWTYLTDKIWTKISIFEVKYELSDLRIDPKIGLSTPKKCPDNFWTNLKNLSKSKKNTGFHSWKFHIYRSKFWQKYRFLGVM